MRAFASLIILLLPLVARGQEVSGFGELRFHGHAGVDGEWWELTQRLRPELEAPLLRRLVLATTLEVGLHQGRTIQREIQRTLESSSLGPTLSTMGCEWPAADGEVFGSARAQGYAGIERLYLDTYLPWADLRLGRQAVHWGSAFLVNPTDPFPEVLMTEPWRPRAGVNALRATVPIGDAHQVRALIGANDRLDAVRVAANGTLRIDVVDLSLVGAWRQESGDGIVGLDVRGTYGVGYWLEAALHVAGLEPEDRFEEIAVGVDYSFGVLEILVLTGQYYRNGGGSPEPDTGAGAARMGAAIEAPDCGDSAPSLFGDVEPDAFAPFFSGTDYGMLSMSLGILPDLRVNGVWVQNLRDGTGLAVPMVSFAPTGWLELVLAAQIPVALWGDGGELRPAHEDLRVEVQPGVGVDLGGLVPEATILCWSRFSF
jgi:hypothetical protein